MLYTITLKGQTPLLLHAMTQETLLGLLNKGAGKNKNEAKGTPTHKDGTPDLEAICRQHLYTDPCDESKLVLPSTMLFAAMREAGRQFKLGKQQISTRDSTTLPSFFSILEEHLQLMNPDTGEPAKWEVDVRRGVNQANKAAVCAVRPIFRRWGVTFTASINTDRCEDTLVRSILDEAATAVGVGSFRPQRGGPFGRFTVVNWEVVEQKAAAE